MRLIISPAKQMRLNDDDIGDFGRLTRPVFLERAEVLRSRLAALNLEELTRLLKCNERIAALNYRRYQEMDLSRNLSPALLSYVGIQYQYMAPDVFTERQYAYVRDRLKILSGLYGLLRPFDGIVPYRLEMQAPLSVGGKKDLYGYWGDAISRALMEEAEDGIILNLASREYAKTVEPYLSPSFRLIHCVFGERGKDGKIRVKGTQAKMARGEMVRWLAERGTDRLEELKEFDGLGYRYSAEESAGNTAVFIKKEGLNQP